MNDEITVSEVPTKDVANIMAKTGLFVLFAHDQLKAKPDAWLMRAVHGDDHSYVVALYKNVQWMLRMDGGTKRARAARYHVLIAQMKDNQLFSGSQAPQTPRAVPQGPSIADLAAELREHFGSHAGDVPFAIDNGLMQRACIRSAGYRLKSPAEAAAMIARSLKLEWMFDAKSNDFLFLKP